MELLYADDLVLCRESLSAVMDKYGRWKKAVEAKGLRVNFDKTKCMQLLSGKKSSVLKVDHCGASGERLGCNSIIVRNVRGGFIIAVLMCRGW